MHASFFLETESDLARIMFVAEYLLYLGLELRYSKLSARGKESAIALRANSRGYLQSGA